MQPLVAAGGAGTDAGHLPAALGIPAHLQRHAAQAILSQSLGVPVDGKSDPLALSARVSDQARVAAALADLTRAGIGVTDFSLGQPSLDEVFLVLTGHPAESPEDADAEAETEREHAA